MPRILSMPASSRRSKRKVSLSNYIANTVQMTRSSGRFQRVKIIVVSLMIMGLGFSSWAQEKERPKEWSQILAAARKEGRVVVTSSPDATFRNEIMPKFMARFGIPIEFLAGRSGEIAARIKTERAAGVYSVDVFLFGPDSTAKVLYAEKVIDPLKPLLVLPEVVDATKWKRGKLWFIDPEEKYVLRVFNRTREFFPINAEYVKAAEISSAKDLLNPKWRAKIVTEDPTSTGRPAAQAELFYNQMGEEFFKRLYIDQKLVIARERRQAADWACPGYIPHLPHLPHGRLGSPADGRLQDLGRLRTVRHAAFHQLLSLAPYCRAQRSTSQRCPGFRQLAGVQRGVGNLFARLQRRNPAQRCRRIISGP